MKPERVKSNITSPKKSWSFTGNRLRILTRTNKTKGKKSDRGTAYEGQVPGLSDVRRSIDPQRESALLAAGRQILLYA